MKTKKLITLVLIAFVLFSVIFLIIRERSKAETIVQKRNENGSNKNDRPSEEKERVVETPDTAGSEKLTVYYFHGKQRCRSCMMIESFTKKTLDSSFRELMNDGKVEWKVIDVSSPENRHYIKDYNLGFKSVVLSKTVDGREVKWKNLAKVWQLLGDEKSFSRYVSDEINEMINN